ncbi:unnamed protein product [Ixodes persulcatus]
MQKNQRITLPLRAIHRVQAALADALAVAVGRAISQSLHPGTSAPQPGPSTQPPPVAAFGGLRLQPNSNTQSAFSTTTTSDTWQMGTQVEYQSHPATHAAAAAPPEPRVFAPYAAASDPGRFFVQPEVSYNPYTAYNPQVAGRQRVFTVLDPPTKRDIAEAFVHVQQAARHSQHIGRREVAELQLLECFVQIFASGSPPRNKLRIFDRVRLLYHVAQSGWGAALEGYADPSASLLLGPPVPPRRPTTNRASSTDRGTSPPRTTRPTTRSTPRQPKSPKKPKK